MKLITEIPLRRSKISLTRADRILTLGSCFSDNMAAHLRDAGFDMLANPFGTLYNPESIESAVRRLDSCEAYSEADCVEMGAGASRTCSFEHHTSFARKSAEEFLENANRRLEESRRFWKECNRVLVTYGTARVWRHGGRTVSPIRYLSEGAEANTISKALLHLGIQKAAASPSADYFPAWELMMDELRDYRFYAADLVHPSDVAVDYLWEKFLAFCIPESEYGAVRDAEKAARRLRHRQITE